jgi:hypothetical protein
VSSEDPALPTSPPIVVLLGLRFVVELALFAAIAYVVSRMAEGTVLRLLLGVVGLAAVTTLWGVLLSPRRHVDLPLTWRVVLELALVGIAAAGLLRLDHPTLALALVVAEVVVLGALAALGFPPGADAAAPRADRAAPRT